MQDHESPSLRLPTTGLFAWSSSAPEPSGRIRPV